ncbi:hypothetical protein CRYUN_Cryun34aG0089900 [Craigia yunnanensis]
MQIASANSLLSSYLKNKMSILTYHNNCMGSTALSVALEELKALKDDVHRRVDCAEQQLMIKRLSQVQVWLSRVETMITEAEELIKDGSNETQKLCLAGCFSKNCRSRYKFGRRVARKLKDIVELKSKGVFGKVAEKEPTASV